MVKSRRLKQDDKTPRLEQVVVLDIETTGLIMEIDGDMPFILQLSAVHNHENKFNSLVWPSDENFEIQAAAAMVHGLTRESLQRRLGDKRPNILDVWYDFIYWLHTIGFDLTKDIYLCAYNGFTYDFRVIIHDLRRLGYEIQTNFKLIDPWLDHRVFKDESLTLDKAFKQL